jgi:WD40 repeat protein
MARVFISHSSRDNEVATEIKVWLASRGFDNVFLDIDKHAGIPPGANWERELYRKIDSVQAVILVITPNWHESKWCFVEFAQARALGKAIFPVIVAPGGDRFIAPDIQQLDLQRDREGGLERLAGELTRLALDAQAGFVWDPMRPPYPGLLAFEKEDAAVFFGRDDDIRGLIERLNARRVRGDIKFVTLLGSSGSGKSSVVRAGVLPRLERDKHNWIILPPFRPRRDPVSEFARAACEALGTPEGWRVWRDGFVSPDGVRKLEELADALRLRAGAREAHVLVTIDQGEELFTVATPELVGHLFGLLDRATTEDAPVVVLMALRSDYLGRLQAAAGTLRLDEFSLGPFPLARVRQVIEGPARIAGIGVEEELVASVLADMGTDDALPLLAFMLRELHDRFGGRRAQTSGELDLSLAHYQMLGDAATGLNPLENAVRKRADEVVDSLRLPDDSLVALREAFVGAMVRIDDEGQYVRRSALWDDLPAPAQPVLEEFAKARLVVIRHDAGARMVEVAHEALLRKWKRLRAWLDAEREFLIGKAQLRYALVDFEGAAKTEKDDALLQGLPLARAREWLKDHARALTQEERGYIDASIARDDTESSRKVRRRRIAWAGAVAFVGLALGALFLAREQQAASTQAEAAALAVQARSNLSTDPIRAVALAARAAETRLSVDTQSIVLEGILALSPHLAKVQRVPHLQPAAVVWAPDSAAVAVGGEGGRLVQWQPFASPRAKTVVEMMAGPASTSDKARSPIVNLAWNDGFLTAVLANGQAIKVDTASQRMVSTQLFQVQRVSQAAIGTTGHLLVAQTADDIRYFDCASAFSTGRPNCTGSSVASGHPSAVALDDEHSVAALGFDDGTVQVVGVGRNALKESFRLDDHAKIVSLAWSRDGLHLAVGTVNGRALVSDVRGRLLAEMPKQSDSVSALAWDSSSLRLASVCNSVTICVWQLSGADGAASSLQLVALLTGHSEMVRSLAFARDGRMVASAANDDTVRLWSVGDVDRSFFTLDAGDDVALTALDVSVEGKSLAAGDDRGGVHVWSLATLSREASLRSQDAEIAAIGWSPRGSTLAIGDNEGRVTIRSWPDDGKPKSIVVEPPLSGLRWLPDGSGILTSGSLDGAIVARSVQGDRTDKFEKGHREAVLGLAVGLDGRTLLSTDALGKIGRWNISTRKLSGELRDSGTSRDTVAYSHDGRRFLVAGNDGDVLVFRSESDEEPIRCSSGSQQLDGAGFSPDDSVVAAVSKDAILHIWSLSDRCEILASAPLPVFTDGTQRNVGGPSHRRHLIFVSALGVVAVTASTRKVMLISFDAQAWLRRARSIGPTNAD